MKQRPHRKLRAIVIAGAMAIIGGWALIHWGNDLARAFESDEPSRSVGTTRSGSLVNGKRLPTSGPNFRAYGRLPVAVGRNFLHGRVRNVVLSAYAALEESRPGVTFVYAECSLWPSGGRLRPHRNHQNGLSVDFIVPVKTDSSPTILKTHIANKYGYGIHVDTNGWCETQQCRIDFDVIAAHLHGLADAANAEGLSISRVVFAPDLQPHLFATEQGRSLRSKLTFSKKPSWVRHDEHYHLDFDNPDRKNGQQDMSTVPVKPAQSASAPGR